ncbi:MAG TPA: glycosyl hydrolase-related protein, partial [Bacilli bacterium]
VTDGLPEYEVLRDDKKTMALTLLRCVGELGDWNYFPTPGAQCLGAYTARFAIVPHQGDYRSALRQAYEYNTPMRTVSTGMHAGTIASKLSWINICSMPSVQLTSLKKADTGKGLQLRFVNLSDQEEVVQVSGELTGNVKSVKETLLNEKIIGPVEVKDGMIRMAIPAKRIFSLMLEEGAT